MERKTCKSYLYEGFGFPVQLIDVPMIKTRGEWVPDIDFSQLEEGIVRALAIKPLTLSGNQIKFIRKYFKMTLEAFGGEFGVSHVAVIDWESEGDNLAKINPATEKCIRMFITDTLEQRDEVFREIFHKIPIKSLAEQQKTKNRMKRKIEPFKFNMKNLQTA